MKILFYSLVCATIALFFSVQPVRAAFPSHTEATHNVSTKTERRSFEEFINATIQKYSLPVPPVGDAVGNDGGILNIISFALGLGGLAAILVGAFVPAMTAILITIAVGLGIGAIITGAKGKKRGPLRGLGVAGFILGIIDLAALVIALLALIVVLAFILFLYSE
ncbi:MAG: hypothetical protein K0R82_1446 [Flavipsychrobacter sp.]|jgi:hypothetical protein|nr:hypothetical protein [Flavipsychrobacter sp.]